MHFTWQNKTFQNLRSLLLGPNLLRKVVLRRDPLFISFLGNQNILNKFHSSFPPELFIVKDTAETWFSPGSSYSAQSHLQFPLSFSSSCCTLALHTYVPNFGSTFSGSPSYRHKTRVGGQRGQREIFSIFYFLPKPTVRLAQTLHPTYLTWYTL